MSLSLSAVFECFIMKYVRWHIMETDKADEISKTFGQCFDLAYHYWCGSAKYQHELYQADIYSMEQRIKKLEARFLSSSPFRL